MTKKMLWFFGPVGLIFGAFFSAAINLMGIAFAVSTLVQSAILNNLAIRRAMGLITEPPPHLEPITLQAKSETSSQPPPPPGSQTLKQRFDKTVQNTKKSINDSMSSMPGMSGTDAKAKAEQNRKKLLKELEDKRKNQRRDEWEKKFKR